MIALPNNYKPAFHDDELAEIPPEGFYPSTVVTADFRLSVNGNPMLLVIHELGGVPTAWQRVPDCFVLQGVGERALATARRRLVALYRACGMTPTPQQAISPDDLLNAKLQVRVEHSFGSVDDAPRLRIAAYRTGHAPPF
jgi:hypothetical protein